MANRLFSLFSNKRSSGYTEVPIRAVDVNAGIEYAIAVYDLSPHPANGQTNVIMLSDGVVNDRIATVDTDLNLRVASTDIGALADTAWTGSGPGSVISLLKKIALVLLGTLVTRRAVSATTATTIPVDDTSTILVASNANRKSLLIVNNTYDYLYIAPGTAVADETIDGNLRIDPLGHWDSETSSSGFQGIYAAGGTGSVTVWED